MPIPLRIFGRKRFRRGVLKALHVGLVSVLVLQSVFIGGFALSRPAYAATDHVPVANPTLPDICGLDIALAVDISGSITPGNMVDMKTGLKSFVNAFTGTPTQISVSSFATDATTLQGFTPNLPLANNVIDSLPAQGNGNTNWASGLHQANSTYDPRPAKPNLIVIATDGSPNRFGFPTADPAFDWNLGLENAIDEANLIKNSGTRIVVLAIGADPADPSYDPGNPAWNNPKLTAISGSTIATTPAAITSHTDVIKVTNFAAMGAALAAYANTICAGHINIQKQFDTDADGDVDLDGSTPNALLAGWTFSLTGAPDLTTTNTGAVSFPVSSGTYAVTESTIKPLVTLTAISCVNGQTPVGVFNPATRTISGLQVGPGETVNCTALNTATPVGSITVEKIVDTGSISPSAFGLTLSPDPNHVGTVFPANHSGHYTYTFTNLPTTQTYDVVEDVVAGYHQVSSTCANLAVTANIDTSCVIHNAQDLPQTGTISGSKTDNHGQPLNNWQICLVQGESQNCVLTGDPTKGWLDGQYRFENVPFGTYTIRETMQQGWEAVTPASGSYTNQVLSANTPSLTLNFVNRQLPANLTVTKDDGLTTATPGQILTYTIVVTNSGSGPAVNARAVDTLPAHATYLSSMIDGINASPTVSGSTLTWNLGTMLPSTAKTISLRVQLDTTFPFGSTNITNMVVVHNDSDETTLADNQATDTDVVTTTAVLGLQKTGPATIHAGDTLTYTLHWSVSGTAGVTGATISDPFPANTTFVGATCGTTIGTCSMTNDATHSVWNLGNRAQGEHGTVTLTLQSSSALSNGVMLTNTATFDSVETDPVQSTVVTTVQATTPGSPLLSITKTNNVVSFTNPGQIVTYTVVVKNAAAATASAINVMVTDVLPAGFTFVDTGLSTKVVAVGTIAPGNSVTLSYDVRISTTASSGSYTNVATAKGENTDPISATSLVPVRVPEVLGTDTEPTLTLQKKVNVSKPIASGSIITYTVTVKNTGENSASNVVLADTLPKGFTFLADGSSHAVWNIGTLKPGHSRVILYDVKISNSVTNGVYRNAAIVTSDNQEPLRAHVDVTIKNPKVLGLADTGAGTFEYLVLVLSGLSLLLGASLALRHNGARHS